MKYFSYQESKEYLKSFQIESSYKFYRLVKSGSFDPCINKRPFDYFNTKNRKDWISWEDFLSFSKSEVLENKYLKFDDAKKIVHELRLKSQNDWNEWCKSQDMKMLKIPTNPNVV